MSTLTTLTTILVEELGISPDQITPESVIQKDLGADSFDEMTILMSLEHQFDIDIRDDEVSFITCTVQDLVNLVESKLSEKQPGRTGGHAHPTIPIPPPPEVKPAAPKDIPGKYNGVDPRSKLKPGEPWFFLRAQDYHAPAAVRSYASVLSASGDAKGSIEVYQLADAMSDWQEANMSLVKLPD